MTGDAPRAGGADGRYDGFPPGFFDRVDPTPDRDFYRSPRIVTHIDDGAIAAVGRVYRELGLAGRVLDLMSSWISHFDPAPEALTALGMNGPELAANRAASGGVVADLNRTPALPFADGSFDAATCCVSVDYLTRPIEVFDEVARALVPGGIFCCTFSNRCFPTKVIRGWSATDDDGHVALVAEYFRRSGRWGDVEARAERGPGHDPLFAVWAARRPDR